MILAIRTDAPEARLVLLKSDGEVASDVHWQADRRLAHELLGKLEQLLSECSTTWQDLSGLIVYQGPGSFTGLRIGITVMNTIAYAEDIPIVGADGDQWIEHGIEQLASGEAHEIVLPEYGAEARITKPRK